MCGIFQCMKGVNRKEGDPNYDLFKLALESTAKRLYPNYCNVDWSVNEGYDKNDPKTYVATMRMPHVQWKRYKCRPRTKPTIKRWSWKYLPCNNYYAYISYGS